MTLVRSILTVLAALAGCTASSQERAPGVQRLRFEVEVDVERARAVGWTAPDDEAVVGLAARLVQRRFAAMERAAVVEREPGTQRFRVSLPSIDSRDRELIEGMLRSLGVCELLFAAEGGDVEGERAKLASWRAARPAAPLDEFNALDPGEGGPANGLAWFATQFGSQDPVLGEPFLVRLPAQPSDSIGATSFARTHPAQDQFGYPSLAVDVLPSRAEDLARVTRAHRSQRLAIVLDGKVRTAPTLEAVLSASAVIEGRFDAEETARLAASLASPAGPLRVVEAR